MNADIAFFECFREEEKNIREHLPSAIEAVFFKETIQEAAAEHPPSRFLSIRTQSVIPDGWHDQLDAVLTRSQGFDHIHRMFTNCVKPVALGYLGPYCSRAVAEHALMLLLMSLKKTKAQMQQFYRFDRDGLTGTELSRRRVLIFGVGQIGSEIGRLCRAWDMDVRGVDIQPKWMEIDYVGLDEGIAWAEVIICAAPLTEDTRGLLNYACLSGGRPHKVLINISRGELSPVEDLLRLLDGGQLSAVGLDVFPGEKDLGDKMRRGESADPAVERVTRLADHPGVICTPHNAFNSAEALERKSRRTIEAVTQYFEAGRFPFPVPQI